MDGNGRWAAPGCRRAGHRAGTRALRRTVEAAIDLGVESLVVYAFSTENWSRPHDEVDATDGDLRRDDRARAARPRRSRASACASSAAATAPRELRARWRRWRRDRRQRAARPLDRFDYGGRAELVEAARRIVDERRRRRRGRRGRRSREHLYAPEMPDPDLLIRTSGELRVSNFLLWQLAYAELVFVDTLWPDFGADDLRARAREYARRRRRFGGR